MRFLVKTCLTFVLFVTICHSTEEKQYECGAHGRFEYCIDGIPGCVVGCHCHPGYYFDTDSKICEPNTKLIHANEFRRSYAADLGHFRTPVNTPVAIDPTPTPTPTNDLDQKVDEIAKDTDDIGDWLYNQFFKTIESQVINNTNNEKVDKPTRRSGGGSSPKKSKRKNRKSAGKKKKRKVHGLRRKLLRITEDDSLFDSDSSTDDDSSTTSESESSDTSSEEDQRSDRDHGHKEIIMYNKNPKPPLPSFIFLPHMNTPFYPPIGLPPPPVLPMYPLIPVPPMAPMIPVIGSTPKRIEPEQKEETTTTAPNTTVHVPTPETTVATETPSTTSEAPTTNEPSAEVTEPTRLRKRRGKRPLPPGLTPFQDMQPRSGRTYRTQENGGPRNKMIKKLREKMKLRHDMIPINHFMDNNVQHSPFMNHEVPPDSPASQESYLYPKDMQMRVMEEEIPNVKDVDFKYLSELIHRTNLSDANNAVPQINTNEPTPQDMNQIFNAEAINRRSNTNDKNINSYAQLLNRFHSPQKQDTSEKENAYYTSLGRQIASMIRNIDSKGQQQVDIELVHANPQAAIDTLNDRFSPRSYWERSVRSPLNYFKEEFDFLKHSNEKLYSLENEVENLANTEPTMSLQDLENILNTMNEAQHQIQRNVTLGNPKSSNINLNINLLPKSRRMDNVYINTLQKNKHDDNIAAVKLNKIESGKSENKTENELFSPPTIQPLLSELWMLDKVRIKPVPNTEPKKLIPSKSKNMKPTRKPITYIPEIEPQRPHVEYLKFLKNIPYIQNHKTTQIPYLKYHSQLFDYKTLSYTPKLASHYPYKQNSATYPVNMNSARQGNPERFRPSYFHHELHHFDYFD